MMASSASLVTVVIPVFNREEEAIVAVNSVLEQNHKEIELIVVDDGSDKIPERLKEIVESSGGRFIRTEHRGVSHARNVAMAEAKGEWIALLDSDDSWLPEKLSTQLSFLEKNPEFQICQVAEIWYRNGVFVNPKNRHQMPHGEAYFRSLELCCVSDSAVIVKRELVENECGFREELPICEDYDYWLRLAANYQIASLDVGLVHKFGGAADQLSRSQRALDRFRVYALLCLLRDIELVPAKERATIEMIEKKATVLAAGAEKRGDSLRRERYGNIIKSSMSWLAGEPLVLSQLEPLISEMEEEIALVIPGDE